MSGVSWEFEIIFSPQALRDLKSLEKNVQARIKEAAEGLACFPATSVRGRNMVVITAGTRMTSLVRLAL